MALEVDSSLEALFQILSRIIAETDTLSLKSTKSTERLVGGNS